MSRLAARPDASRPPPRARAPRERRRDRVRVSGTVQGVGFRPFVYRLADELGLSGYVLNDARGVLVEVEGDGADVERFLARLEPEAPPLAVLERVVSTACEPTGETRFAILPSPHGGEVDAPVTPDSATCAACLRELNDPSDRRYRYPFINCTDCGPRFTIVIGVPYDRPRTTMRAFGMCADCQAEYDDPTDRRFHAQPNACPRCGPSLSLLRADGTTCSGRGVDSNHTAYPDHAPSLDAIALAATALRAGAIVAIKGIGGYHLACRADDERAVAALRARKHREDKPFALMTRSPASAASLIACGERERALMSGPQRPIVLASRRKGAPVADAVAPGAPELGVMLPYTPLHHLLLADCADAEGGCATLVMTSGNVSDEPIAYRDGDALERLAGIADLYLVHDRPIHTRTDDSVVRVVAGGGRPRPGFLRRSRGYVPSALPLPVGAAQPLLACGGELKSTFCLARDGRAWVSHHIGDLENYETLRAFTEGIEHFEGLFAVSPEIVAHDLHPEYLSSKYALERDGVELIGVQHHHAHLAACLAEHGETGQAVGAIFDGSGYGADGTLWGGEILYGDLAGCQRVGSLLAVGMPGGAKAIEQPWRIACAWLCLLEDEPPLPATLRGGVSERAWGQMCRLAHSQPSVAHPLVPLTTSMGRLFDAVAALCGLRASVNYEGQAAVELEAACDPRVRGRYPIELSGCERLTIDPRATLLAIVGELRAGIAAGAIASRFHATIAHVTAEALTCAASTQGVEIVVLSGGVFQNRKLLEATIMELDGVGLRVLVPELLPANDGGISYGQAAIAAVHGAA
ncbi:MAG TPA: carbamoyltransferase HypF [Solirubrobacteraceae bacterium]|nr:carbamoyltransferase HypF [Solirubrobacteraceae bacterium]